MANDGTSSKQSKEGSGEESYAEMVRKFTPEYCKSLYEQLVEYFLENEQYTTLLKWKNDVLVILRELSLTPNIKQKTVRKKVLADIDRLIQEKLEEEEDEDES